MNTLNTKTNNVPSESRASEARCAAASGWGPESKYHRLALKLADNMCGYLMVPVRGSVWRQAVVEGQYLIDQLQAEAPNGRDEPRRSEA